MNLAESRIKASQLSGGTSTGIIKDLVIRCLRSEAAQGSVLDFGAGKGELLKKLHEAGEFDELAGVDLFPRPEGLDDRIDWIQYDLNEAIVGQRQFDAVICSETVEHLENPRHTFRCLFQFLKPGGLLVLTMPNQESIRSYLGLLIGGHFTHFLGSNYPAHITALLRMDLARLSLEVGFSPPVFHYTNRGVVPKLTRLSWQGLTFGLFKGRLFSDNLAMTARKPM